MAQDAKSRLPKENTQAVLFSGLIFDAFRQIKKGGFFYMPWKLPREEKEDPHGRASPIFLDRAGKGGLFPLLAKGFFPTGPRELSAHREVQDTFPPSAQLAFL
ncbi:MAG: hypothetical protein MSH25_10620 [Desulfovibrio sp.]|uniref:hypothetical protein n=1 Tax=Desulfovibrio sp. TaxID=885 RepID=UPI0025C15B2F|nr:hypothetical protein [Desulfovibrio sp.]MCI7569793.1 hypothetical protein [Desulfovibrio sp.]